ncbi:MAG TPA: ABC transporter permease [Xanthomonadaceae bacterium]|jgi:sodium transport system permease protein|nr:ABC transporter permease [Xanthomonadaceae bacterium]
MNHNAIAAMITVMLKELRDLFRDKRTIRIALLMAFFNPLLMLGLISMTEKRVSSQLEKPLELPVVGAQYAPNLVAWLSGQNVDVLPAPVDADATIRNQDRDVILSIGKDYPKDWHDGMPAKVEIVHDSSRQDAQIPVERVENLLQAYSQTMGSLRLVARGVSPAVVSPLRVAHRDLATPESKRGLALSFLPYLLILSGFLGGANLVIDATAGERERQSLEPLLATPSTRSAIMSGKIAAACLFGMLILVLTLVLYKLAFTYGPSTGLKFDVSLLTMSKLLLVLAPVVLLGTTLLTLIAASAKSVKEAQGYMNILVMLPLIPTLILLVNPIKTQIWQFAVPFLSQNQLIMKLLRMEVVTPAEWSIYLLSGFGLGLLLWAVAAQLYHRERLAISA